MSTATLSRESMTPALFDLDGDIADQVAEIARNADRELCKRYLGTWTGSYGSITPADADEKSVTFQEFQAAAQRLSIAA